MLIYAIKEIASGVPLCLSRNLRALVDKLLPFLLSHVVPGLLIAINLAQNRVLAVIRMGYPIHAIMEIAPLVW